MLGVVESANRVAQQRGISSRPLILSWSKAQDLSISDQLNAGIRYLDLRVSLVDSTYVLGHVLVCGTLDDALQQVLTFTQRHPSELHTSTLNHVYGMGAIEPPSCRSSISWPGFLMAAWSKAPQRLAQQHCQSDPQPGSRRQGPSDPALRFCCRRRSVRAYRPLVLGGGKLPSVCNKPDHLDVARSAHRDGACSSTSGRSQSETSTGSTSRRGRSRRAKN